MKLQKIKGTNNHNLTIPKAIVEAKNWVKGDDIDVKIIGDMICLIKRGE